MVLLVVEGSASQKLSASLEGDFLEWRGTVSDTNSEDEWEFDTKRDRFVLNVAICSYHFLPYRETCLINSSVPYQDSKFLKSKGKMKHHRTYRLKGL